MSQKIRRLIQILIALGALLISMKVAGQAIVNWSHSGVLGLLAVLIPLLACAIPIGALEWQIRSIRKAGRRVLATIEDCAKKAFDEPGAVRPGYDIAATAGVFAFMAREADNDSAFTTDGTFRGARVSIASHVSTIGRQMGEMHHVYSHVVVDVLGLDRSFRLSRERTGAKLIKALGAAADVNVGDEAFDKLFLVSTDEAFAKDVLDDSIRQRLIGLQNRVGSVSIDYGTGGMGVLLSNRGLALRWPGDLTPELAIEIRDLLLDMRERMLAHENRKAVRVGENAAGYRITADAAPGKEEEQAEDEAKPARAVE